MDWLNFHHLRYFWMIARRGSLTQASAELHLTPQTVSAQISSLEKALGEKLFNRSGRGLVLSDVGKAVYRYADEIFTIGQELLDMLREQPNGRPLRLIIGIADVLPKFIAYRMIKPLLELEEPVHLICREARTELLLAELALHNLDVVLSDMPIPPTVRVRAFSHLLGDCGVTFMAMAEIARRYRRGFPRSLDGAPFLLPTDDTSLRVSLDRWFDSKGIHPVIVGEFADSALIKVFGQAGEGVFAVASVLEDDVRQHYGVQSVGKPRGIRECFYAISVERKIQHPAVSALVKFAKKNIFS